MSEVWGYENNDIIRPLHLEFCKYIMKVKKNCIVYGELERKTISVPIKARMIGFWERILTGRHEKISRTLYDIICKLSVVDVYHFKWLNCVKYVLTSCGYVNCWRNQSPENVVFI